MTIEREGCNRFSEISRIGSYINNNDHHLSNLKLLINLKNVNWLVKYSKRSLILSNRSMVGDQVQLKLKANIWIIFQ